MKIIRFLFGEGTPLASPWNALALTCLALCTGALIGAVRRKARAEGEAAPSFLWPVLASVLAALIAVAFREEIALAIVLALLIALQRDHMDRVVAAVAGFLCGRGMPGYAILLCALYAAIEYLCVRERKNAAEPSVSLMITVPEDMRTLSAFEPDFAAYTDSHALVSLRTVEMGMLLEQTYRIRMKPGADSRAFLDAIRGRNGNLPVSLSLEAKGAEK